MLLYRVFFMVSLEKWAEYDLSSWLALNFLTLSRTLLSCSTYSFGVCCSLVGAARWLWPGIYIIIWYLVRECQAHYFVFVCDVYLCVYFFTWTPIEVLFWQYIIIFFIVNFVVYLLCRILKFVCECKQIVVWNVHISVRH